MQDYKLVEDYKKSIFIGQKRLPRRVAYIHDTNTYGGVEVFLLLLMRYLDPERYTPAVLVPGFKDLYRSSPQRFIRQVEEMGVPLIEMPAIEKGNSKLGFLAEVNELKNIFKSNQFDVVHTHTCWPFGARKATIGAWMAKVPVLLRTEHGPPLGVTRYSKYTVKPLDWMTDYILTVSDATTEDQRRLVNRNPKKLYRSYGGIELDKFNPYHNTSDAKRKIGLDPAIPVVGTVGRLCEEKGHTYLIRSVPRILQEYGPVNFVLVGEGILENDLKKQVADLNLEKYVHLVGYQPDLNSYMEAMDIGVMPSVFEGLGLALLEFMALAKPTVASTAPCFEEVEVNGETGFIASIYEENALAGAILRILRDKELAHRMGQAALQRVRTEFSIQRLADDMMNLYDSVYLKKKAKD